MNKKQISIVVLVLFVFISLITNPGKADHSDKLKTKINTYMKQSVQDQMENSENEWEQAGAAFGLMLGEGIINSIVDNNLSVNNFLLFSTSSLEIEGKKKTIGFGFLGNVFIASQIEEALEDIQ